MQAISSHLPWCILLAPFAVIQGCTIPEISYVRILTALQTRLRSARLSAWLTSQEGFCIWQWVRALACPGKLWAVQRKDTHSLTVILNNYHAHAGCSVPVSTFICVSEHVNMCQWACLSVRSVLIADSWGHRNRKLAELLYSDTAMTCQKACFSIFHSVSRLVNFLSCPGQLGVPYKRAGFGNTLLENAGRYASLLQSPSQADLLQLSLMLQCNVHCSMPGA